MEHRRGQYRKVKRRMELDGEAKQARPLRFRHRWKNRKVFQDRFRQRIGFGEQGDQGDQGDGCSEHLCQNTNTQEECDTGQADITIRNGHGSSHGHTQV